MRNAIYLTTDRAFYGISIWTIDLK